MVDFPFGTEGEKQTSRRKDMMTTNTINMQNSLHVFFFFLQKDQI